MTGRVIEAELRIIGSDKSGDAWAGVIKHAQELQRQLAGIKGLKFDDPGFKKAAADLSEQVRLLNLERRAAEAINRSFALGNSMLRERTTLLSRIHEKMRGIGAVGAGGILLGPGVLHGAKESAKAGADIQSESVKMRAAGIGDAEIKQTVAQAQQLSRQFPNVEIARTMERYRELRSVLLHPEEAKHLLPTVIQAQSALRALDRSGHLGEGLVHAVRGAEVLGLAQDPVRFKNYLDSFVKASQVMGRTITPEQMFEFAKYSKASGATLSDRFKMTTGLSLSQEIGGSTAGTGVDQFIKQVVGGFQGSQHAAAKEFIALGLADKDDFETTKTGSIKGFKPGRHVRGHALAMSDPDLWVYQNLLPALENKGITDPQDQLGMVRRLFPSGRAADIVAKIIQQRPSFENHAKLYEAAEGIAASSKNMQDAFVALDSLGTSVKNFAAIVTHPAMQGAAEMLSNITSLFSGLAAAVGDWQEKHPDAAKAIGGGALAGGLVGGGAMTYGLIAGLANGFGLKGSAVALTESAAAINAAAVRLGGGSAVGTGAGVAAGAAGGWAGWLLRGGMRTLGPAGMYFGMTDSTAGKEFDEPLSPEYRRRHGITGPLVPERVDDVSGANGSGQVKAELQGTVKTEVTVKVEPSPDFLTRVFSAVRGIFAPGISSPPSTGSTGSTGRSMPEAGPHP